MVELVDVSDLDCVFLSYDEPDADENFIYLKSIAPWAKRVHGVEGSDAAHKAAAAASNTERFILIDGDNRPDPEFFNQTLRIDHTNDAKVFRWRARNIINGLCYGNGGISSWTKTFVQNMKTHEATDGTDETVVEFCFADDYWAMHDVWSTTYPNATSYQAWRAGFREGVKLCLARGRRIDPEDFESETWIGNRDNLEIWCSVGNDVNYGDWAIMGARYGAYKVMFDTDWDYTEVRDFDKLNNIYENFTSNMEDYVTPLTNRLGLDIVHLDPEQSKWYKAHRAPHQNIDIMMPEHLYRSFLRDAARKFR
jgi:hypothetical protein